ncbi:hypothetical protein Bca4012_099978 [Brassica carinata]
MKGRKRKNPSTTSVGVSSRTRARKAVSAGNEPARETTVVSLSVDSESDDMSDASSKARQPPQPLELYFKSTEFTKTCKIQTKCFVKNTVDVIKKLKEEVKWFTTHPQFRHFFHMPDEQYLKLQGMWMLLLRTISTEEEDVAWFSLNGVPIRYSMREHALISGLDCHEYPRKYLKLGSTKFVDYYFGGLKKITITDVEQKLLSMKMPCNDRLKMAVLSFPWGRLTFEDAIKNIKHMMELLKGEVHPACGFPGFIIPLEILAFECILSGKTFRLSADTPSEDCPRMCKSRFTKSSMKGYPLEDIYAALGHTKVINSVLVPTVGEKIMLARIIDEEREYHCEGSTSDTWNHWLNVKQEKIFWKELYDLDVAARVFKKKKDKEKVTFLEDSSSKSGLESLKALEEKILGAMSEGFSGLKSVVEAKLGDMDVRMSKFEKNQRQLRRRAKKIEEKLTSIESNKNEERNYGEDMDFGWDDRDYGRAESKENSEKAKEDKENSESGEENDVVSGGENSKDGEKENNEKGEEEKDQEPEKDKENSDSVEKGEEYVEESDGESSLLRLQERVRVQAEEFWRTIDDESEAEEEVEKEGEEEAEKEVQEEKEGEKEAEKEVQEEKEGEKEAEKEAEKEVQEEKEAEKVESKGTPTSTGVIVITPHGRTKAAAARKAISISPEIVVVTGIVELAEKEVEIEATQTEQEAIQTEIVEKEAEVTEKDAELAEKEDQDVDEEEEKAEESEDNPVESPSEKHAELAEKSVESDVDLDVEEEEEKAEEIKDNLVESPAKKQTELAEKSVEVELKTKRKPKVKVIAVPYGISRAERLGKMRAEAEKKKARAEKKKAKADGAPKKKGRPKKTEATLKPCTPLLEKRKSEPSRWVQSPFTEGKTDELEVPKKKLKTKT